jgi:DNA-directed RNA polymerase subunit N (RpoN/RPB10)
MIIPIRCFTCGKVIGDKWNSYLIEKSNLEKKNLNEEDQAKEMIKVFEKLGLKRYCCRGILISTVDLTDMIS